MIKLKLSFQAVQNVNEPVLFFTQVAIIFACTRAVQDISYSYLPLFLTESLDFRKVCVDFTQLSCYDYASPNKNRPNDKLNKNNKLNKQTNRQTNKK